MGLHMIETQPVLGRAGTIQTPITWGGAVKPPPFFVGIIVGLATLSWAGASAFGGLTRQFTRFHRLINLESKYFPTVRQIEPRWPNLDGMSRP
jgi:hypothetical protein